MRRNKHDMQLMKNECTYYLLQTKLDYHKAYDLFIKEYLESGEQLPYYIKGINDFKNVSQSLAVELKQQEAMRKVDKERFEQKQMIKDYILNLSKEEIKQIYLQYKDKVEHHEKLIIVDLVNMIHFEDLQEKYIDDKTTNLFQKIYNDMKKSA